MVLQCLLSFHEESIQSSVGVCKRSMFFQLLSTRGPQGFHKRSARGLSGSMRIHEDFAWIHKRIIWIVQLVQNLTYFEDSMQIHRESSCIL